MAKEQKEQAAEIRIVKKKGGHAGHHGGAWKVAYADFVTAMMAFFMVMWICGMSEPVKDAVSGYFKDPVAFMEAAKAGEAPFAVSGVQAGGKSIMKQAEKDLPEERKRLEEAKATIERMVRSMPEFRSLRDFIDINLVDEGLRVDLLEARESMFFDAASAKVKPAAAKLLRLIAREFKSLPNSIIFEGHTDPRPLAVGGAGYTNWELSADRANSARRIMVEAGLPSSKVAQVRGYAATQPRNPDNPTHYTNRRVSIIVVTKGAMQEQSTSNPDKKQFVEPDVVVRPQLDFHPVGGEH